MEILSHIIAAKSAEYIIALLGLFSFIVFWNLISAPSVPEMATLKVTDAVGSFKNLVAGFIVPQDVMLHPGHAWAKVEGEGIVAVGLDDFASKLVGKVDSLLLPDEGTRVRQGEKAWSLKTDSKFVEMLSPVDGEVLAVNRDAINSPGEVLDNPYESGWLLKIKSPNLASNLKNMLPANSVSGWMESIRDSLGNYQTSPSLQTVYQDGGSPVEGIARLLDPEHWDEIAKEYFLTKD